MRFKRGDKETNASLFEILSEITDEEQRNKLKDYFAQGDQIELLTGERILCG